jgi:hypothetical protein
MEKSGLASETVLTRVAHVESEGTVMAGRSRVVVAARKLPHYAQTTG